MATDKKTVEFASNDKLNLIDMTCKQVDSIYQHMLSKNKPELMWMFDIQKFQWEEARDAEKNGQKLIAFGGPVPLEIMRAFNCVPFFLDCISTRIASQREVCARYIDETEKYAPTSMCGIDKAQLGVFIKDELGIKVDAFVHATVPCDSARIAYPIIERVLDCPCYTFDCPFRHDEKGYAYLASQFDGFITFMEELTGLKWDAERYETFKGIMEESNKAYEYLVKIAELRKKTPCPLPGRTLVLNELAACMCGAKPLTDMLEAQLAMGTMLADMGMTSAAGGQEKYRVCLMQNMPWSDTGTLDWLEKTYGAIPIMDGFGHKDAIYYEDMDNWEAVKRVGAMKMLHAPMIHGATGPNEYWYDIIENMYADYNINVSIFMGHVGCKHTWAGSKIVTDMIQEKFGIPTLYVDLDAIDPRYKSANDLQAQLGEYMESVVGATRLV
ncbi:MAG: 2-hydroxyacyl-CoA dehydratase family protein [Oscillospiraceae bacterium]